MSRRPAHLEMTGGKSPRQRVWEAIRAWAEREDGFTTTDLSRASKVAVSLISEYLKALVAGGFLRREDRPRSGAAHRYWMVKDVGLEAPRLRRDGSEVTQGRGNESMWNAMRHFLPTFDFRELAAYASTPDHPVFPETAKAYIGALHAAGYLDEVAPAKLGSRPIAARYALRHEMKTGPRAPMVQRTKVVFDPNQGRVVWHEEPNWEDA